MKEIKLNARLCAYSKVDSITCEEPELQEMTKCEVDKLFGETCDKRTPVISKSNEVTTADIDYLFSK